jgi:nicotinamide mononucleotide transporter
VIAPAAVGAWFAAHWLELFGAVTGAISVWLAVRENVWNWWIGIVNNAVYLIVFFEGRLFGDASLQVFYIAISVYGIVRWLHGGDRGGAAPVRRIGAAEAALLAVALLAATFGLQRYFAVLHDAAPLLDAFTTAGSIIAQYMLARKYLENWLVWIVVDAVSIYLYVWKELQLTAALYALFLAMCIVGFVQWRAALRAPATA